MLSATILFMTTVTRRLIRLSIKSFLALALMATLYFTISAIAARSFSAHLKKIENTLSKNRASLLELHLALDELRQLDPNQANFNLQRLSLIDIIRKTPVTSFDPIAATNTTNDQLTRNINQALQEHSTLQEKQGNWIRPLTAFDSSAQDLFAYNPDTDLGQDVPTSILSRRASDAYDGLARARDRLPDHDDTLNLAPLHAAITTAQASLQNLSQATSSGELITVTSAKRQALHDLRLLRSSAFAVEQAYTESNPGPELSLRRARLLQRYQDLLQQIAGSRSR
jgi:hypothetical protein